MKFKLIIFLLLILSTLISLEFQDLNTVTPTEVVQYLVNDESIEVSSVTYFGNNQACGIITGGASSSFEFDRGIILSSGNISGFEGPNNTESYSTDFYGDGSSLLNGIIHGNTRDAAELSFSFMAKFNTVRFSFSFSSEEYLEFVGTEFNDVFGFFIDGVNYAYLPGTDIAISVNSINHQSFSQLFVNNPANNPVAAIQPDGYTVTISLTAEVDPTEEHNFTIAIADRADGILDSWVILQAGSFVSLDEDQMSLIIKDENRVPYEEAGIYNMSLMEDEYLDFYAEGIGGNINWMFNYPNNGSLNIIEQVSDNEIKLRYEPFDHYNGEDQIGILATCNDTIMQGAKINLIIEPVNDKVIMREKPELYSVPYAGAEFHCSEGMWFDYDQLYAPGVDLHFFEYQWMVADNPNSVFQPTPYYDSSFVIPDQYENKYIKCKVTVNDVGFGEGYIPPFDVYSDSLWVIPLHIDNEEAGKWNENLSIFPNPANPKTNIEFFLPIQEKINISIYNTKGQLVEVIANDLLQAGKHQFTWSGKSMNNKPVTSGIYFISVTGEKTKKMSKIILLK